MSGETLVPVKASVRAGGKGTGPEIKRLGLGPVLLSLAVCP